MKAAVEAVNSIVVKRPRPGKYKRHELCLDKGYDFPDRKRVFKRKYVPHIRHTGEKRRKKPRYRRRHWVVEQTNSWHNRFRSLLIRYGKSQNYLGLVQLTCRIIVYRRLILG